MRSPAPLVASGRRAVPPRSLRALAATAVLAFAAAALAHGGPPLRIGVTADPLVNAVGRLALVHLREGVGFAVEWREFADEKGLREAFAAGRIDIAAGLAEAGVSATATDGADALREEFRRRWGGEAFVLTSALGPQARARAALIVARGVLADLRFGILGKEAGIFAAAVTRQDVDQVRAAAGAGGERAAVAAARAAWAAKAPR